MRRMIASMLAFLLVLPALAGCAGRLVLPESRPADYTMLVTVYPAQARAGGGDDPAFRAARYAVESDGLLRAEGGAGVVEPGFPRIARRLEPAQLDAVYALAREAETTAGRRVPGPLVYTPPGDASVAVVEIGSGGVYRAHEVDASPASRAAPLIRELARLSWLDG